MWYDCFRRFFKEDTCIFMANCTFFRLFLVFLQQNLIWHEIDNNGQGNAIKRTRCCRIRNSRRWRTKRWLVWSWYSRPAASAVAWMRPVCKNHGSIKRGGDSLCYLLLFFTFWPLHAFHATGRSQRRQRCCQYRYDNLNNCLPTFLLHSFWF